MKGKNILVPLALVAAIVIQSISSVVALPPVPPDHLQPERAWIKEDGMTAETWGQYNDTGQNRLNLTYRHSIINIAYVIRSSDPSDQINTTFIIFRNQTTSNGFNSSGHLFAGSNPVWSVDLSLSSKQTLGDFTYHLYMVTFDPEGIVGTYQIRINITGSLSGGSSWTSPYGNPDVPWMFFEVPEGTSFPISVSDQLFRFSPFFFDTPIPSTLFNASLEVEPPGNFTGATTAHVRWNHTNGTVISESDVPVYYVGNGRWAAQSTIAADNSTFPANFTHPYSIDIRLGSFFRSGTFWVYPLHAAIRPDTWLTSAPPAQQENTTADFSWIGSDLDGNVIGYEYKMDSGTWISTTNTSMAFYGLQNGSHRLDVRAMDDDGLVDTSPAFKEFLVIINSPPDTEIIRAPNATASTRDAYFEWTGTDIDGTVASYGYRLDQSEWVNTTETNLTLLNLSSGNHTFQVRAIDNRGDTDPTPAKANFTIPPTWCESELARLNGIIDSLGDRISELESIITNLTSLLESSEEDNQALRAVIQQLEDEKADLQGQVDHLAGEKSSLLSQLASLVEENAGLEGNLTICHDLSAALQQQVQNLTMTISQLLDENSQLELDREQLRELVEELQERIRELEAQIPQTPVHTLLVLVLLPGLVVSRLRREP